MAMCTWCHQEMRTARTCTVGVFHVAGRPITMVAFGREQWRPKPSRCGDCGVARDGWHHPGCDLQECPVCAGQMLSCGCRFDEDAPEDDDDSFPDDEWDEPLAPFGVDANGSLLEAGSLAGIPVLVRREDVPDSDITAVNGIPCTTALRTLIDIAATVEPAHLRSMLTDALARGLFSEADAWTRLGRADMAVHAGAALVRRALGSLR